MKWWLALLVASAGCGGEVAVDPIDASAPIDASRESALPDAPVPDSNSPRCRPEPSIEPFFPELLPPPSGKHQGRCSQTYLVLVHACLQGDQNACAQIGPMGAANTALKDCIACLESTVLDATWGPAVYVDAKTYFLDVEGCVNLATGESGPMSCGQRLHEKLGCERFLCQQTCGDSPSHFMECAEVADQGACKKYVDAFDFACRALSIATFPDLDNCFRRQTETDATALRVRMDTYFCGP